MRVISSVDFSHDHFTNNHFIFVRLRRGDGGQGDVSAIRDSSEEFRPTAAEPACSVSFINPDYLHQGIHLNVVSSSSVNMTLAFF